MFLQTSPPIRLEAQSPRPIPVHPAESDTAELYATPSAQGKLKQQRCCSTSPATAAENPRSRSTSTATRPPPGLTAEQSRTPSTMPTGRGRSRHLRPKTSTTWSSNCCRSTSRMPGPDLLYVRSIKTGALVPLSTVATLRRTSPLSSTTLVSCRQSPSPSTQAGTPLSSAVTSSSSGQGDAPGGLPPAPGGPRPTSSRPRAVVLYHASCHLSGAGFLRELHPPVTFLSGLLRPASAP